MDLLINLSNVLATEDDGVMFAEEIFSSKMIRALLSSYVMTNGNVSSDFEIYIDDSIVDNNMIDYNELVEFFRRAPKVLSEIKDIPFDDDEASREKLFAFVKGDTAKGALNSKIMEGSFSSILCNFFTKTDDNNFMIIPEFFVNKHRWVTTKNDDSEIKKLITALNKLDEKGFDIEDFFKEDTYSKIVDNIKKLDNNDVTLLLESAILYYSISNLASCSKA